MVGLPGPARAASQSLLYLRDEPTNAVYHDSDQGEAENHYTRNDGSFHQVPENQAQQQGQNERRTNSGCGEQAHLSILQATNAKPEHGQDAQNDQGETDIQTDIDEHFHSGLQSRWVPSGRVPREQ